MAQGLSAQPPAPAYWLDACAGLSASCSVMRALIDRHRREALQPRGDPFQTLARSIVGQQISVKAASSVWVRLEAWCAGRVDPLLLAQGKVQELRGCGLSERKAEYLRALGEAFASGRINPKAWAELSDEAVILDLVKERGIGRWTAEMFLIFNLLRPDVWPLDDIGLLRAVALHWGGHRPMQEAVAASSPHKASREQARAVGEGLRPWRSVATWYLWRSLDPVPVAY
ncbi:MAG: DNA-3-methyladenine glycosylase family protein [Betaproteobacteria bacterium]